MTRKRSKISYRELLAPQPPPVPPSAPEPARPGARAEPAPPPAVADATPAAPARRRRKPGGAETPAATASPPSPSPAPAPAVAIAERIASLEASDAAARDDDEPAGPLPPLRERARQRTGMAQLLLFRVGSEWFATDLAAAEEAIELPEVHHVPEMPESMLGMFDLRGHMLPIYAPTRVLGVALRSASAATLVLRGDAQRVGIAVDDVEDVFTLDLSQLRDLPGADDADGVVLGVARHGTDLVAVLDAEALVAACLSDRVMESV